mmetsp:Transcript_84218/g.116371  ORF Transcript_84218/g.116371 Transcript_84218/m.116371 type:complete len:227 (-) Transcript_84218:9-689(-)
MIRKPTACCNKHFDAWHPTALQRAGHSLVVRAAQALALALRRGGNDQADDEAVQTQSLGEDQYENHADEEPGLLRVRADAGITDDADREAGRQGAHAHGEAGAQVRVARVGRVVRRVHLAVDDHRGDQAVDTQHTSHDNRDDGAHHHVGAHHAHGGDADARLGRAVGGAEVCEDDGRGDAHEPEEGRRRVALLHRQERGRREQRHGGTCAEGVRRLPGRVSGGKAR